MQNTPPPPQKKKKKKKKNYNSDMNILQVNTASDPLKATHHEDIMGFKIIVTWDIGISSNRQRTYIGTFD